VIYAHLIYTILSKAVEKYIKFLNLRRCTFLHFSAITLSVIDNMADDCVALKKKKLRMYSCAQQWDHHHHHHHHSWS
jgi:hypothetical protein